VEVPAEEPDTTNSKEKIIASLEEKIGEVKTNWQNALADTDNLTKKMLKEIAQTREQAADKLAISLFPVSDTLDFCLRHRPDFDTEELKDNVEGKGAFDGLEAAKRQFVTAMRSINITELVPQLGDEFDPMMHNACFEVESSPNAAPGQIGVVIKTGWAKNNTLLRAADVGVAKAIEKPYPFPIVEEEEDDDDAENVDFDEPR